ncbi:hypothetical protein VHEMI10081 [[Torrubiella] hemipterigena]|uniref:UFSP1/2/DUB catalytic domain-containing protein n=1 Tax=[Torrubiella] hemipterigena TaxID=1531966 RepID=A0A0A1TRH8_9HYPO|nr:hypothetical protein VHEMI10081 [[Torrubiella] hemipterigena]
MEPKLNQNVSQSEKHERLGVAELGKFGEEDRMPRWLEMMLQLRRGHVNNNMVSAIASILAIDPTVVTAHLCHEATQHISKTAIEETFCGYRNIQMILSCLIGHSKSLSMTEVPSILDIQVLIEKAWDNGILSESRIQTGGILKSRKYIGTPEVCALFTSLNIRSRTHRFISQTGKSSYAQLVDVVQAYFSNSRQQTSIHGEKIHQTELSPIFLQRPGHSLLIIGVEKRDNGHYNLLVFDPDYRYPDNITKLLAKLRISRFSKLRDHITSCYRRSDEHFAKYSEIEILYPDPI